ncbi:64127e8e-ef34-4523-8e06-7b9187b6d0c8 [Sclerotinia trifoliorum]|uniref:Protein DOM34 homolog n=1 Tax=Sclerotinia trifoliorum TaxID=28548 RepID=A0A8H2ZUP8_9HELO|nr:64127e8e-ef34-4523-8e06-7b9187b6d0c8 [Sclerotinia trifoliorum]
MRLIKQNIERDGSGTITLLPEEPEDMWHAYNLIAPTDILRATAIRKVSKESSTGSTSTTRVHLTLSISVTAIDFDPQAGQLHVKGRICEENMWVKVGAFHTLDLELQRNFTLEKYDGWDSVALDVVKEAVREDKEGVVPAVVMQEGMANICLITEHQTILKQRIETGIPKKRNGMAGDHDNGIRRFYQTTLETLLRHVDITQPRPLLLASPGFVAQGFQKYILDEASRTGNKAVLANKKNFVVVHSSSGHLHSLNEILKSQEVLAKLSDTKYARETRFMDEFMTLLRRDDGRAWYGPAEVEKAVEKGAVGRGGGVLLINNELFRSQEIQVRKRWVRLVDKVKEEGGEARILSSDHESGKRLAGLGGIAAILTYPLEDLDEESEGEEEDDIPVKEMQGVAIT